MSLNSGIALSEPSEEFTERVKRTLAIAEKIDIFSLMKVVVDLLRAYGNFAKSVGEIQQRNADAYELILEFGKAAPQILKSLAEKSPPAVLGTYVQISLRLLELQEKMNKIMQLSPEEKMELGEELVQIANSYEQVLAKIKEEMERTESVKT